MMCVIMFKILMGIALSLLYKTYTYIHTKTFWVFQFSLGVNTCHNHVQHLQHNDGNHYI